MATFKSDYRLRLPGPTQVPERVRQAIALPVWNHRGPEFRAILSAIQDQLKPILGTANPVMIFASSGTGMMEASLINILAPGERVLVPVCGQFGERFAQIARAMGAASRRHRNSVGPPDRSGIALRNKSHRPIIAR